MTQTPTDALRLVHDDLKLIIAHTIIEDLRVQHPGIEQIDNERGDIWIPGGSTPQSSGCVVDIHSVAQSVEQQVLSALRPSHTDLMVSPESIDAFLEAYPPEAAPASPLPGGGWQDISTAPKDGTHVLLSEGHNVWEGRAVESYGRWGWWERNAHPTNYCGSEDYPTHWMPLPPPPAEATK